MAKETTIYFIQCAGPDGPIGVKIGYARDPGSRVTNLQTGSPYPLKLIGRIVVEDGPGVESNLHGMFARAHIRGEWFAPVPEILDLAARCADYHLKSSWLWVESDPDRPVPPRPPEIVPYVNDDHHEEPVPVDVQLSVAAEIRKIRAMMDPPARRGPVPYAPTRAERQARRPNAEPALKPGQFAWRGKVRG